MQTNANKPPIRLTLPVINEPTAQTPAKVKERFTVTAEHARTFIDQVKDTFEQGEYSVLKTNDLSGFYDSNDLSLGKRSMPGLSIHARLDGVYNILGQNRHFKLRKVVTTIPLRFSLGLVHYKINSYVLQQMDGNKGALRLVEPGNLPSKFVPPHAHVAYSQLNPEAPHDEAGRSRVVLDDDKSVLKAARDLIRTIEQHA